jgi:hypothetical protein
MSKAFTARLINRLQRMASGSVFVEAATKWLMGKGLIGVDFHRRLFLVHHPEAGWQVAVWMMPGADMLEPAP